MKIIAVDDEKLAAVEVQMFYYGLPILNLVLMLGAANIFAAEIRRKTSKAPLPV